LAFEALEPLITRNAKIWDVTLPVQPGMPVWPGDPLVETEPVAAVERGDSCNVTAYRFGSHTGTHLDPPRHFFPEGAPLEAIPPRLLIGACHVADLTRVRGSVTDRDLETASIPPGTERLLLKTSNSRLWDDPCHAFRPDFVDLSPEGAGCVLAHGILLVGIDYLSIEGPTHPDSPVHRSLLGASVVILEGLDLREIDAGPYGLICLPLRTVNGDGAPARVLLTREA
jgi:arylformamidase